jgi:DNA-binding NarL/FixJ family response regulator
MLRRGKSTTVIASSLDISSVTVRRHISKLMQKAGVGDRDELMRVTSEPNPTTNANTHERSDVTLGS